MSHISETGRTARITTLVDFHREGRFVIAFCPLCDHAEEAEDVGGGREQAASVSVSKIEAHLRRIHRNKSAALKITILSPPQTRPSPVTERASVPAHRPGKTDHDASYQQQ